MQQPVKVFDKYWFDLDNEQTRLEVNQVIVYKKRAHQPNQRVMINGYCVARMETFSHAYNSKLTGGKDICKKAIFWQKDLALVFAKLLASGEIDALEKSCKLG